MYGIFTVDGKLEPKSNQKYDDWLRLNYPGCGIRDLRDLKVEASKSEITLEKVIEINRYKKLVIWKKE